jgi:hypothetical protein
VDIGGHWAQNVFLHVYIFKNIKTRTLTDPDKISGKMFQVYKRAVGMFT